MKNKFWFVAMAAIAFSACNKIEEGVGIETVGHTIKASMEVDAPETRTAFGQSGALYWIKGDDIAVLNTNGGFTQYTLTKGEGTANATFTAKAKIGANSTYALHPYSSSHAYQNSELTFYLPETYEYEESEKGDEYGVAPMIAQSEETDASNFYFEHLGGAFCFTINNLPANTTYFKFEADEQITGEFPVTTNTEGKLEISLPDEQAQSVSPYAVTINFPAENEAADKRFFIPLPVGTIDGFKISLGTSEGVTWSYTSTKSNTITRRQLLAMPEVTLDATVDGTVLTSVSTLDELKDAIANGKSIILADNITAQEIIVIDNPLILDGNGYKIISSAGRAINVSGVDGVTIKNLTIEATGERAINVIQGATNIIIDNVTATAANYTVNVASSAPSAEVTIRKSTLNGLCTVNVSAEGACVYVENSTINCNDNNTTEGEGYAALSLNKEALNGKIIATGTTINVTEGSDSYQGRNVPEGGEVTINGSTDGVAIHVVVITYPNSDYYYSFESLAGAVNFAKDNDVITLIRNVEISELITVDKPLTIDLNGKTITANCKKAFEVYANTTIKGGTIVSQQRCVDTRKNINLVLTDLTLKAEKYYSTWGNQQPLTIGGADNGTEVTLSNVTINAGYQGYGIISFVKTTLNASESNISGYAALYVKPGSENSVFNFTNITSLSGTTGSNDVEGNKFATIAIEANDVKVNIDNTCSLNSEGEYHDATYIKDGVTGSEIIQEDI